MSEALEAAAALRAAEQERDAATRALLAANVRDMGWQLECEELKAERDAALAQVEVMREALERLICSYKQRGIDLVTARDHAIEVLASLLSSHTKQIASVPNTADHPNAKE